MSLKQNSLKKQREKKPKIYLKFSVSILFDMLSKYFGIRFIPDDLEIKIENGFFIVKEKL